MMAEQFGPIPFKNAKESSNVFFNNANEYIADGKYTVTWAFNYTPNVDTWRAAVVAALTQYTVGGGSWDDVVTAFVQGWATQYANPVSLSPERESKAHAKKGERQPPSRPFPKEGMDNGN